MYKTISNYYSIFFSSLIIYSIFFIKDIEQNLKICCMLNMIKSLNFYGDIFNFYHHIFTIGMCLIFLNNSVINEDVYNDFSIINKTNISTLFLILRSMYKSTILDALFTVTFLYYRINFNYNLYIGNIGSGLDQICNNEFLCRIYMHGSFYFMSYLNIYWIYLLINKFIKLYKLDYYYLKFIEDNENIFIILVVLQSVNYIHYIFSSDFMKENSDIVCNQNYICQLSFYSFFYTITFLNIYYTIKVLHLFYNKWDTYYIKKMYVPRSIQRT
jgi:hypothetical protein